MKKFTLIEMLVVIAIIGILSSMLLPAITSAVKNASALTCVNNLRQGGVVFTTYADNSGGWIPVGANFHAILALQGLVPDSEPGVNKPSGSLFFCPLTYEAMADDNPRCWFESVRWKTTYKANYYAHRSDRKSTAWLMPHTSLDKVVGIRVSSVKNPSRLFHIADAYKEPRNGNLLYDAYGGTKTASAGSKEYQWSGIWHAQAKTGTLFFDLHVRELEMPMKVSNWFTKGIDEDPWIEK